MTTLALKRIAILRFRKKITDLESEKLKWKRKSKKIDFSIQILKMEEKNLELKAQLWSFVKEWIHDMIEYVTLSTYFQSGIKRSSCNY